MRRTPNPRLIALFMTALAAIPSSAALTDYLGAYTQAEYVLDATHADDYLPCNKTGITWNGIGGNALLAQAVQLAGQHVCDKVMMDAAISLVRGTDVVAGASDDGELMVRFTFPVVRTPILTPFRNQDPDSPTFSSDALRDAKQTDVAKWVPYLLNPNDPVPCTEATTGLPNSVFVKPPMPWSVAADLCENVGVAYPEPVHFNDPIDLGDTNIVPPRQIAMVDRIFLLKVRGVVPLVQGGVQTVFEATFSNVVVVNNMATEALDDVKEEVERTGHTLEQTVFEIEAYLTEAAAALGDAVTTTTGVTVVDPANLVGKLITLPQSLDSQDATAGGSCQQTKDGDAIWFTVANGCVAYTVDVTQPGVRKTLTSHDVYAPNADYYGDGRLWVEHVGDRTIFHLPPSAGLSGTTSVSSIAQTPFSFKVTNANVIRVTRVWDISGDIDRRCDPGGTGCIATGADLYSSFDASRYAGGHRVGSAAWDWSKHSFADRVHWCAPDLQVNIPFYWIIQPFIGCLTEVFGPGTLVNAFNRHRIEKSSIIDLQQNPEWLTLDSRMIAQVCCADLENMPEFRRAEAVFVGFKIEAFQ